LTLTLPAGIWFGWAFESVYGDYGSVRRITCFSSLHVTARASLQYAADFDDHLMPAAKWMDCLGDNAKYVDNFSLHCQCLGERRREPTSFGFAFFSNLSGRKVSTVEFPEHIPLVYESSNWAKNASDPFTSFPGPTRRGVPESRRSTVFYLDGKGKMLGE
jgi:hypothetical protein